MGEERPGDAPPLADTAPDEDADPEVLLRLQSLLRAVPLPEVDDAAWAALVDDALRRAAGPGGG
ncbi:hypothetical protein RM780_13700 [Streptomyces sp. DSM 44917]|uniref:Uncharacterized protein n=1 Tax=Streptomyces boetiae TaxID=3075541 RepID=A0ABU2L8V9_9ACTN|nr:hypothetical protein [Streptomyces sp. DSM 44917]MDT0308012.1 hypothetical protein [Streptomyces sp. DSM 44917]